MYKDCYIILFILICWAGSAVSQVRDTSSRNPGRPNLSNQSQPFDSMNFRSDSLRNPEITQLDLSNVAVSGQGLSSEVDYGGDSTWYDASTSQYHLYGKAFVNYENMQLNAGYIVFDIDNDIAEAYRRPGKNGILIEPPTFVMDENRFTYRELKFNFKTKKGIVTDAVTQEGEFYLQGAKTKFISKETDSLTVDDEIYNQGALISTCDEEHKHWGIRTNKLKLVPNKLAVFGLSQLEIAGIPTPLVLPFGFFPLVKGQSSGLILPDNYEYDADLGLGFREIGYYFPINDYVDLRLTGDIYTRGTYRVRAFSNYRKRYSFSGTVNLGYSSNRIETNEADYIRNGAFSINISHRQDSKAHPYRNVGGSINIQTDNYRQNNFNDAGSQLNNRLSSNFNFTHSMPGTPFSFRMGLSHDQNNATRKVNITLPDIALNMNTIFPFERKNATGGKKWYEKISMKYDLAMKNLVRTTDTMLFTSSTLENMQTGVSHDISSNASFNVAKYFTFTPSVDYDELWYFSSNQQIFDPTPTVEVDTIFDPEGREIILRDTTAYGETIESIQRGFQPVRLFRSGFSLRTQIFGTKRFSKGFLRGIRHVMKPTISFNFSPDSRSRYLEMVDTDSRDEFNTPREYNPYTNGALRSPSLSQKQMAVNFGLNNVIEGKYFSKKDSTEKKFKIIRNLDFRSGYNFAADSLNWQDVSFAGTTTIAGLVNIRVDGRYSPYVHLNNRRTGTTLWAAQKKLLEFRNFNTTLTTDFSFKELRNLFRKEKDKGRNQSNQNTGRTPSQSTQNSAAFSQDEPAFVNREEDPQFEEQGESILDLLDNFRFSHRFVYRIVKQADGSKSGEISTNTLSIRGNLPITDKWKVTLGNITYDFKNKSLVYPTLGISRDLHCWTMSFNWFPRNGVYSFFIGVNSSTFSFLKYNYGQNNAQNFFGNRRF